MEHKPVRRSFDRQFKIDAVHLITEGGRRATEVARDLGISVNVLYRWKKQLTEDSQNAFPGKGFLKAEDAEFKRVLRENEVLKQERDILKKALAIFSTRRV